jgi:4'-phosphopantetheinyl transferase
LLPDNELGREFASARRRREYLCGRALLRGLLQDHEEKPGISYELTTTKEGKPVCVDGPPISISHTGDFIACCIAGSGDIGIDIETNNEKREVNSVASKFFSAEESAWLDSQPKDRFFMLWVLKEAYVKAIGRSIFGGINRLRCTVTPPHINVLGNADRMHHLCLYRLGGKFLASASSDDSLADIKMMHWDSAANALFPGTEARLLATSGGPANQ